MIQALLNRIEPPLGDLENAYHQRHLGDDIEQTIRFSWVVVIANLSYIPIDISLFQQQPTMMVFLLWMRISIAIGAVAFTYILRRVGDPSHYQRLVMLYTLSLPIVQSLSASTRPITYYGTFIFDILLILCCYSVVPNILRYRLYGALVMSGASLAMLFFGREISILYTPSIPVAIIGVNVIGLLSSTRVYSYRRREYRAIHEAQQLNRQLTILAETDPLTGVLNRRKFIELGNTEYQRFRRYHHQVALVMLDLDHFKSINDRYGHAAGDLVLREMSELILAKKRTTDQLGRLGGEEFGLLLPETALEAAITVIERVRKQIHATTIKHGSHDIQITFSAGVVEIQASDHSFEDALRRADQLLYQAKQHGRNRIEHQLAVHIG
jgi:diguanylate cyclase (GGDEF)-like protein